MFSPDVERALRLAEEAHAGQTRKGDGSVPYILHPIHAALILARAGADETAILAGILMAPQIAAAQEFRYWFTDDFDTYDDGSGPGNMADFAADNASGWYGGWNDVAPSKALDATWSLIRATNAYLETNEPWKTEPGAAVDAVMGDALEALRIVSVLAYPAMPQTAQIVWERIGFTDDIAQQRLPDAAAWGGYPGGLTVTKGDALFPRIKT